MPDILHRVGISASAQKVFAALSEEHGLAGWWTKDVKASPAVGAINQFRFGDQGFNEMKVVELSPGKRVKWLCVSGAKEWIGTELTFDLRETDGATVLLFAQCGWKEQVEFMHYCSTKWGTYLLGLKSFCEIGQGILWRFWDHHLQQGGLGQLHFMGRSTFNAYGYRKTVAVCHGHDLRSLATFRFANLRSPFLAGAKLPSMKASWTSSRPRIRKSSASASRTPRMIPDRTHC